MKKKDTYRYLKSVLIAGTCFLSSCSEVFDIDKKSLSSESSSLQTLSGNPVIVVSNNQKQLIRMGVDAERLWFWRSGNKNDLAMAAVGDMRADYVRVAINCAYERENCVKNEAAYKEILEMMTAMKTANPDISFFASPRPLHESYTAQEKEELFGDVDNVPWSPYPLWIQQWRQNGTRVVNGKTVPRFEKAYFDAAALVQYFADYLNLMHSKGFNITYLDVTNEQTIITPAINKYIYEKLPTKLGTGVNMPLLVAPSSWSTQGSIDWIDAINTANGEHNAFTIASSHNTGAAGNLAEFVTKAQAYGKEVWNSELHGWTGLVLKDEILNSSVFWDHIRAGYSGIDTWLFFGPLGGRDHSMINSNGTTINKSGKYEIFKQVVNNANKGYYVDITQPVANLQTAAFIKDNILSVWVLNKATTPLTSVEIQMPGRANINNTIEVIKWSESSVTNAGDPYNISLTGPQVFVSDIDAGSLYFFKVRLD